MENSDVLGDELSELLLRKGTEPFLCSHWQELDGKIKGVLMESNGVFKVRNSSECCMLRERRAPDLPRKHISFSSRTILYLQAKSNNSLEAQEESC